MSTTKKLSWKELKKYHLNPPSSLDIFRTQDTSDKYKEFVKSINEYYLNTTDNISFYDATHFTPLELNIIKDYFPTPEIKRTLTFKIDYNNFPYNIDDKVVHLLCWINPYLKINFDIDDLIEILESIQIKEYVIFENQQVNRSVRNIKHYQLFLKKKSNYLKLL